MSVKPSKSDQHQKKPAKDGSRRGRDPPPAPYFGPDWIGKACEPNQHMKRERERERRRED
jgi:hypothetical protein